jgi:glycosyltransferase involved in cell wall biosynthesis
MPKVSIIIPVYNAVLFIDECVESLLNQTLTDCEFIFVNDGSTDQSALIIEKHKEKDNRVILINQNNQGISIARNTGLQAALGEYIGFCDNDDYLKPDMLETLYVKAKKEELDIIVSKTILGRDGKYIIKDSVYPAEKLYDQQFSQKFLVPDLLKREDLFAVWNKLYRREFIEKFAIRFPANRNIEEDSMFNLQAFNKAEKIMFTDYSGYYYRDVAVNESRKFIERDYFQRAIERYHFDYKSEIGLMMPDNDINRFKALRFIHRVFYLIFRCATDTKEPWAVKKEYILKMIKHDETRAVLNKYSKTELEINGRYQQLIFNIIKNRQLKRMVAVAKGMEMVYSPAVSEILRKINK